MTNNTVEKNLSNMTSEKRFWLKLILTSLSILSTLMVLCKPAGCNKTIEVKTELKLHLDSFDRKVDSFDRETDSFNRYIDSLNKRKL